MPVFSSQRLPGLFHPGNALGVQPFRGFPSQGDAPPRRCAPCPLGVFSHFAADAHGLRRSWAPLSRAASIATGPSFAFRALLSPGVRALRQPRLRLPRVVPLLGFDLPTVFPSYKGGTDFAAPPLSRFAEPTSQEFPLKRQPAGAPEFFPSYAVALRLATPPDRFEVSCLRLSRPLES